MNFTRNELELTIAALLMLQEGIPETAEAARELIKRFSHGGARS